MGEGRYSTADVNDSKRGMSFACVAQLAGVMQSYVNPLILRKLSLKCTVRHIFYQLNSLVRSIFFFNIACIIYISYVISASNFLIMRSMREKYHIADVLTLTESLEHFSAYPSSFLDSTTIQMQSKVRLAVA